MAHESFIELDGNRYPIDHVALSWDEEDWSLRLVHADRELYLEGTAEGDSLKIDLRSLDALLQALQGAPITTYPGGQSVCAASLAVTSSAPMTWSCETTFDWDRFHDAPGVVYETPRTLRMHFALSLGKTAGS